MTEEERFEEQQQQGFLHSWMMKETGNDDEINPICFKHARYLESLFVNAEYITDENKEDLTLQVNPADMYFLEHLVFADEDEDCLKNWFDTFAKLKEGTIEKPICVFLAASSCIDCGKDKLYAPIYLISKGDKIDCIFANLANTENIMKLTIDAKLITEHLAGEFNK